MTESRNPPSLLDAEKKRQAEETARELRRKAREVETVIGVRNRDNYGERRKEWSKDRGIALSDVGPIDAPVDPVRRAAAGKSLLFFLQTYFPESTGLRPFSTDHERVIARLESCIRTGGRFVNAVYRGFAKTTISERAAMWAILFGYRRFVVLVASDMMAATGSMDSIKMECETNQLLREDFPEAIHPVWHLDGKPQACRSQNQSGQRTFIDWTADQLVFASVLDREQKPVVCGGSVIVTRSMTGRIRGLKYGRPDGSQARPDFVIVDDPQTDESAKSDYQVRTRLDTIQKTIVKLAGHKHSLACVINATVIHRDDVIDQLLDQSRFPAWQGERLPMVRQFAKEHQTLWLDKYAGLRNAYDRAVPGDQLRAHQEANEFYRQNRAAMDEACVVSWEHCYDEEWELSAIQHAYNFLIDDGEAVFSSECQNRPLDRDAAVVKITARDVESRCNGIDHRAVPKECTGLTAFIDVQGTLLFYTVAAWSPRFGGAVIDYGAYPEQRRRSFTLADANPTLQKLHAGGHEAVIFAGLEALTKSLMDREWEREDGQLMRIGKLLIDANWGTSTDTVKSFCRRCGHGPAVMPAHGRFVGAASQPFSAYKRKPGEQVGSNWRVPSVQGKREIPHVLFDTNAWKSFVYARLAVPIGDPEALTLWGKDPSQHRTFADHILAEYAVSTEGRGRKVDEWKQRPNRPDNHWLDCLVGCAVGASMIGSKLKDATIPAARRPPRKGSKVSYL